MEGRTARRGASSFALVYHKPVLRFFGSSVSPMSEGVWLRFALTGQKEFQAHARSNVFGPYAFGRYGGGAKAATRPAAQAAPHESARGRVPPALPAARAAKRLRAHPPLRFPEHPEACRAPSIMFSAPRHSVATGNNQYS